MIVEIVFDPIYAPAGENVVVLCEEVLVVTKLVGVAGMPFRFQSKVNASELVSVPTTVRLIPPLTPTTAPVAAGVNEAQTGGVFLLTTHVLVAELEPLLAVATKVLSPVLNTDEFKDLVVAAAPLNWLPFKVQVTAQPASLGVTEKTLAVSAAALMR